MLKIVRGRSWSFDATIYDTYVAEGDPGNVPTNHTGWTIRSQIRTKVGNKVVANLNVTFPVPTAGTVAIRHDRVFTRSLPIGSFWWDIVATDPSGIDHNYIEPEPIEVHDHPTDPANSTYDFVPGGGGAVYHTHSISDITGLQALLDDRLPPDGGTIARYLRGDNTWQLLNKSAVGLPLVENVTLSTWAGSANITQLGTVISGSWQGSRIAPAYLGDGTDIETKFLRGDGTWQTVSGGGGATAYIDLTDAASVNLPAINTALASALAGKAATSHTHTASQISDSTATGRSILTAANQAAARSSGLGSGATGDELFQATTPAAARTTMGLDAFSTNGSITGTGALTFTGTSIAFQTGGVTRATVSSVGIGIANGHYLQTFGAPDATANFRFGSENQLDGLAQVVRNSDSFKLLQFGSVAFNFMGGYDVVGRPLGSALNSAISGESIRLASATGNITTIGKITTTAATASTSTTTGALIVSGGVGVAGAVNAGSLALTAPLPITSGGTGATTAGLARTALGSGATGDELFTAATPSAARTTLGQITATSNAQIDAVAYAAGGTPVTGLQSIQLEADTLYELSWYGKFTSNGGSGYLWLNFSSAYDDLGNSAFQQFGRFHTTVANPFLVSTTAIAAAFANLGTQTNRTAHGSIRFKTVLATQVSLGWSQWNAGTIAGTSSLLTAFRVGIRPV